MASRRPAETVAEALALLSDPEFHASCDDTFGIHHRGGLSQEALLGFFDTWGVAPPWNEGLYRPAFRQEAGWLLTGRWGLVAVLPSTTDPEIRAAVRQVRRVTGKRHRDSLERELKADKAAWLKRSGFGLAEIAAGLYGRGKDAKRPTLKAVKKRRLGAVDRLVQRYTAEGIPYRLAERRAYLAARGTEGRSARASRMASSRAEARHRRDRAELVNPRQANELTAAVQEVVTAWFAIPQAVGAAIPPEVQSELERTDKAITRLRNALMGMIPADGVTRQKP